MGDDRNPRDRFRNQDRDQGRDNSFGGRDDAPGGGYRGDGGRFDQRPSDGYGGRGNDGQRSAHQGQRPGRSPQGYDQDDRGFIARAGDEVRSWFGDDDAERRREFDSRYDDRHGSHADRHYGEWRRGQISALDRDYEEYRRENQQKFHEEFGSWRTERQGQRSLLEKVTEHMEVAGSDGQHVGTVDKVRGDRIILTKSDEDAGGHHHSIPSRWLRSIDDKVTIIKSANEAHRAWRDEERRTPLNSDDDKQRETGPHNLNRSFSGTYRD